MSKAPLVYPLAEAEAELRRLRVLIARFTKRLDAIEKVLRDARLAFTAARGEPSE
jgi:hypothetical protein